MDGQLVSITGFCSTSNRCLVPWTVIRAGPTDSFCDIRTSIKGGQYGTIELNSWLNEADGVESVLVGKSKTSLSLSLGQI